MKRVLLLALIGSFAALAQLPAEIEPLLAKISKYQYGADPSPSIQLDEMVAKLSGSPERRRALEARFLQFVQSDATPAGKESAFRQLALIGSRASVPVLAPMLLQIDSAEMARYALTAISGPEVDDALRQSLAKAPSDRVRIGIVNSIGHRRDAKAVPALSELLSSNNVEVTAAAAAALASIADPASIKALSGARRRADTPVRELLSEASVVGADHLAGRGDKGAAIAIYKEIITPAEVAAVRRRALKGLVAADAKSAIPLLAADLHGSDAERQVAAIRLLNTIQGAEVTKTLAGEFPKVAPVAQVHLLTAIAGRGDAAARQTVLAGVKSSDPAVRAAALGALGQAGDESSVKLLAETAAASEGAEQSAARRSLQTLRGPRVDAALIAALNSSTGKMKSELIAAAGERALTASADALTKAAAEADSDVRREALRALRNVGGAAQTPALLDLLLKSPSAMERRDATQTLATVLRRAQPAPITAVISAWKGSAPKEARLSLLEVMGQTSNADALPVLRAGIKDPDPEIARAAILALTNWDDATPLADLLNVAKTAPAPTGAPPPPRVPGGGGGRGMAPPTNNLQVLALRGVLRLMVLQSDRTPSQSGQLLRDVMSLSTQLPEKRTVLSLLPSFPSKESLQVAETAVGDSTVSDEAKVAVAQVREALKLK